MYSIDGYLEMEEQGIVDALRLGEREAANIGRQNFLPVTFIGGPRDRRRRYMDAIVAEIPNEDTEPYLYSLVLQHMMHGPCGELNPTNSCMKKRIVVNLNIQNSTLIKRRREKTHTQFIGEEIPEKRGGELSDPLQSKTPICHTISREAKEAREVHFERTITVYEADILLEKRLNIEQRRAYNVIIGRIFSDRGGAFFIDGPVGTASILPVGRIAHSRFKILIDVDQNFSCNISKQSSLTYLIRDAKLIVWDEVSMVKSKMIKVFDFLLKDIMDSHALFGGKVVVFGVTSRIILTTKNGFVDELNDMLIAKFPFTSKTYVAIDETVERTDQRLCNGTRLTCCDFKTHAVSAKIATSDFKGTHLFIPKIPLISSDDEKVPIPFKRLQFPLRLCFAMTINKVQGQTLDFVGIYLREPVFSHGQLYAALSRAKSSECIRLLIRPPTSDNDDDHSTYNVVYNEVIRKAFS
ncbi:uncharacterized protein LOC107831917 [Nicotiana tabacum]|uniref:Uncharacterized protein LOC107831917 n=1 Tax=Nicotiana tabacum TaxID=4097 RepID=A0A1S4DP43_TOBAC